MELLPVSKIHELVMDHLYKLNTLSVVYLKLNSCSESQLSNQVWAANFLFAMEK